MGCMINVIYISPTPSRCIPMHDVLHRKETEPLAPILYWEKIVSLKCRSLCGVSYEELQMIHSDSTSWRNPLAMKCLFSKLFQPLLGSALCNVHSNIGNTLFVAVNLNACTYWVNIFGPFKSFSYFPEGRLCICVSLIFFNHTALTCTVNLPIPSSQVFFLGNNNRTDL